ncbi:HNH endonuclease [Dactylosporangium sp. NPDC050588]|uniref:HNH endonuclease n=1 Tax=Dactylosporangium sp. NPDC050588 TaxID=3157211 RepID=UPI0033F85D46
MSLTVRPRRLKLRDQLLAAYEGRCAISSVATRDVLEAAHIGPATGPAAGAVTNCLLLRADLHNLFDAHLLWLDDDYTVHVAESITDATYRHWHGQPLHLPINPRVWPDLDALRRHRDARPAL